MRTQANITTSLPQFVLPRWACEGKESDISPLPVQLRYRFCGQVHAFQRPQRTDVADDRGGIGPR